ncbi:MAG: NfeD family protein [Candidatus Ventricola sp.]
MVDMLIASLPSAVCVLLGMILIIVEVFLPGFGLPGIGGIVLVGAGVVMVGMHFGSLTAVGTLLVIIAVLAVLVSWVLRQASRGGGKRSDLFLQERDDLRTQQEDMKVLVGKSGTTTSVLRPAGIGDFDGVRLNVVTEGGFIEKDMPIEIVRVDGSRIVVRPVSKN